MSQLKILFVDLETAPRLSFIWHPKQDYIPYEFMVHDNFLLSVSGKFADEEVVGWALTRKEALAQDDSRLVKAAGDMIRKADIVIAHNADNFDIPTFNSRLLSLGHEPLGKIRTIDTLKIARRDFGFSHNNMDYLAQLFGVGQKIPMTFEDWKMAYYGDSSALKKMLEYNKNDVEVLQEVFEAMLPYITTLPALYRAESEGEFSCPYCGGQNLQKRGPYSAGVFTYQRYQCNDCKRYSKERTSIRKHRPALTVL